MSVKKPSKGNATHFFWESKANKNRSRFNLLLLEFGEYLLEDLSAYYFPIPTHDLSMTFEVKDSLKIQGRLKLSTRSLIFEPVEARYPIIKFPYKNMPNEVEVFNLKPSELSALSVEVSGFFTFNCLQSFEMKENNKIAPYKMIDYTAHGGHRSVFALVHGDITGLLVKIEQLRHILKITAQKGQGMGNTLLQPFIEQAQLWTLSFDTSLLVNFHEKMLLPRPIATKKIKPLIIQPGSIMLTESRVYFQPSQLNNIGDSILHFEIRTIQRIFKRRYLLQQTGLEFMLQDNTSHLFVVDSATIRDNIYATLMNVRTLPNSARSGYSGVMGGVSPHVNGMSVTVETLCRKWQRREISNFEYLMLLNSEADRSVNDLTQYPVFPHIIADYTSKKLKLDSPATFRDLFKPIGALNQERLQYFKQRLESMPPQDKALGVPPPFLYGTHYSTPGYVLHYLVRVAPEYMLCLQNGKFDAPDRMFHNIASTWQSCLTNPTDLKELIPEFFTGSGEFLTNFDDLDLGHLYTGERLNDVVLPPWADSPRDFVKKHQKALECEYVSEHLHEWIDLIFGYKQTGPEAVKSDNLYYYLTYEGAVDIDSITDMRERDGIIMQIQEFGQTPKQLFTVPHPRRNAATSVPITQTDYSTSINTTATCNANANASGDVDRSGVSEESMFSPSRLSRKPSQLVQNTTNIATSNSNTNSINVHMRAGSADSINAQLQLDELLLSSEKLLHEKNITNTSPSPHTSSQFATTDSSNANEDIPDISIVHLDESFRLEVDALEAEAAHLSNNNNHTNNMNTMNSTSTATATASGGVNVRSSGTTSGRSSPYPGPPQGSSPGHPTAGKTFVTQNAPVPVQREKKPVDSLLGTVLNFFNAPARPKSSNLSTTPIAPANTGTLGGSSSVNSAVLVASPLPPPPAPVESVGKKSDAVVTDSNTTRSLRFNPTTAPSGFYQNNPRKMVMVGGESYYWHSKAVTGVSAMLYAETTLLSDQSTGRYHRSLHTTSTTDSSGSSVIEATHALIATVSRDANLKVSRVEQTIEGGLTRSGALQVNVVDTTVTPRRTTAVSGSSLSAVILLNDKNHILFSSWDNNIYGYSVSHAHAMGKVYAHDDAVTCLSTDKSNKYLLSGSLDTTVKLWGLATSSTTTSSDSNLIQSTPLFEFNDSDSPIQSVAIDDSGRLGAAGNAEGIVNVYDLKTKAVLYLVQVSPYKKAVNCVKWVPENNAYKGLLSHTDEKLLCGTEDGALVCIDRKGVVYFSNTTGVTVATSSGTSGNKGSNNDLYSISSNSSINTTSEGSGSGIVDSSVSSLECDGRVIYTGHADGTIRCNLMSYPSTASSSTNATNGNNNTTFGDMVEVYRHTMAHTGRVNTLSLTIGGANTADSSHAAAIPGRYNAGQYTALLVSGGEDCCVKLWRIYFSGDY